MGKTQESGGKREDFLYSECFYNYIRECDRLFQNMIDIKNITMEQAAKEIKHEEEFGKERIQIVLQFPE